jgi:predicted nucleotidyltransferase
MYGLKKETLEMILNAFTQYKQIHDVVLFGSRAIGTFKNGSDIDLCIKGDINKKLLLSIMNDLDSLFLPYEIDLTIYDKIDNDDLKEHIDRVGIKLM